MQRRQDLELGKRGQRGFIEPGGCRKCPAAVHDPVYQDEIRRESRCEPFEDHSCRRFVCRRRHVLLRGNDWVAIDPKPLLGDPAFDVASLVRDRRPIRDRRVIERRLDLLANELGHDRERMRLWSWVHAVAWGWPGEARLLAH